MIEDFWALPVWAGATLLLALIAAAVLLFRRRERLAQEGDAVLKTEYEGIEYTHRVLWQIVEDHAGIAEQRERDWFRPSLVAMVFAFHTIEAYANLVGELLAPDIWKDEREFFSKEPYRGVRGKLRKVLELVEMPWTPDERPLRTVLFLKELRDAVAHGKAERFADTIQPAPPDDGMPWLPTSRIRSMVTPKSKRDEILRDVRAWLDQVHERVAPKVDDPFFKACAVGGPSAWVTRSTSSV